MTSTLKRCPQCGVEYSDFAVKCLGCGASLNDSLSIEEQRSTKLFEASAPTLPFQGAPPTVRATTDPQDTTPQKTKQEKNKDKLNIIGKMLGEYQVTGYVGQGGMGTVYSGVHPLIGKKVAFKLLNPSLTENHGMTSRFLAEAKAVNAIGHPNIIDIFSFGVFGDGVQYFVMEYLEGRDFANYLEEHPVISYKEAFSIFRQLLDALSASHEKGIIHRDLKPDNIFLISRSFNPTYVKILDFGIAKFAEEGFRTSHTKSGVPIGTPYYMSPEQCAGRDVDHRTDIYALGVILYEVFTGQKPFSGDSFMAVLSAHLSQAPINPSELATVNPDLERIILWCLKKEKENRPATVMELADHLLPLLERLSKTEESPQVLKTGKQSLVPDLIISDASLSTKAPPPEPRAQILKYGILALALVTAAGVALFFLLGRSTSSQTKRLEDPKTPPAESPKPASSQKVPSVDVPPQEVTIQLLGIPRQIGATVRVDGDVQNENVFKLKKTEKKKTKIRISAAGHEDWVREFYPIGNQSFDVVLVKTQPQPPSMVPGKQPQPRQPAKGSAMTHPIHSMKPSMKPTMNPDKPMKKSVLDIGLI